MNSSDPPPPTDVWWHLQMETLSALLAICAGNSPIPGEFSAQRPVTRSIDVFIDLRLNKRLSKQSWGWWFETLSHPLWRHSNVHSCQQVLSCKKCYLGEYPAFLSARTLTHLVSRDKGWYANANESLVSGRAMSGVKWNVLAAIWLYIIWYRKALAIGLDLFNDNMSSRK